MLVKQITKQRKGKRKIVKMQGILYVTNVNKIYIKNENKSSINALNGWLINRENDIFKIIQINQLVIRYGNWLRHS